MTLTAYDLCGVDYFIQTHDVDLLQKLARQLPPDPVCVNIGAAYGTSALALLSARNDVYVVSVDVKECPEEATNLARAGYDHCPRYLRILGLSQDAARAWRFGPVGLVFVDGGHSYADCYGDMALWTPHIAPGGFLAVHDYEADMLPVIKPAVDNFVRATPTLRQVDHAGKLIAFEVVAS